MPHDVAKDEAEPRACLTCRHYRPIGDRQGDCRYHPPTVVRHADDILSVWPVVDDDEWCGQWESP